MNKQLCFTILQPSISPNLQIYLRLTTDELVVNICVRGQGPNLMNLDIYYQMSLSEESWKILMKIIKIQRWIRIPSTKLAFFTHKCCSHSWGWDGPRTRWRLWCPAVTGAHLPPPAETIITTPTLTLYNSSVCYLMLTGKQQKYMNGSFMNFICCEFQTWIILSELLNNQLQFTSKDLNF